MKQTYKQRHSNCNEMLKIENVNVASAIGGEWTALDLMHADTAALMSRVAAPAQTALGSVLRRHMKTRHGSGCRRKEGRGGGGGRTRWYVHISGDG